MISEDLAHELQLLSIDIRQQTIRQLRKRGFGHLGGCMSVSDIIAVLYGKCMNIDPHNPQMENRDLLVCSKGHAGPAIYAALAIRGFFPMSKLDSLNQPETDLPSHCDRLKTPGIDMTTGSLGQGLSVACGMALASKFDGKTRKIFCILGDGECQEGQIWEAVMFAAQQEIDNLIVFLDYNKLQIDGAVDLCNPAVKFRAFGWDTLEINGHDHVAIYTAVEQASRLQGKPHIIIANTIKGYGCPFALGKYNHHIDISDTEADDAIEYLESQRTNIVSKQ